MVESFCYIVCKEQNEKSVDSKDDRKRHAMLEVVFSDSAAGAMMMAIGHEHMVGGATAVIIANEDGKEDAAVTRAEMERFRREAEERERRGWENAIPFEGKREDIISFPLALSVGQISETGIGEEREKAISFLVSVYPDIASQVVKDLLDAARKGYAALLEGAQNGEPIRVWVSREPDSVCGLYWLMEQLRPLGLETLDVTLVDLPAWEERPDGTIHQYTGWGEVEPYRFGEMAGWGKKMPAPLLNSLANRWRELQKENASLRAVLNGQLVGVPKSLYDSFILEELEQQEDEFKEAYLVGRVLGKYRFGIGDAWVALRIEQMIRDGLLIPMTAPEPDAPIYHRVLRKARRN